MPFPRCFPVCPSTKLRKLIRIVIGNESDALTQTRFLKRQLLRTKFNLTLPASIPKFIPSYFTEYITLGFNSLDKNMDVDKEKKTIFRRKSMDQIFVDDNFRLLNGKGDDGDPLAGPTKDKKDRPDSRAAQAAVTLTPKGSTTRVKPDYLLSNVCFDGNGDSKESPQ